MKKNSGFSLVEIMVCVVILATALLGLLGLQARGLKNNVSADKRTQATLLTYNMIDRMRANKAEGDKGVLSLYVTSVITDSTTPNPACLPDLSNLTPATTCNGVKMAVSDLVQWNRELTAQFCGGNGTSNTVCNVNDNKPLGVINYFAATATAPAFFRLTLSWDENRNGVVDNRDMLKATESCYKDASTNADTALPTLPTDPKTPPYDPCFRTDFQL